MRAVAVARIPLGECNVDLCDRCHALWFDSFESAQLAPAAILALFREVARAPDPSRRALPSSMPCPRCRRTLANTQDLRHNTRFGYWRCPEGHGRLTPFVQFLREKDFIRPLSQEELARLKEHVRSIRCSGCGASVELARDMVCRYCGAPIEALDPDALARTVAALEQAQSRPSQVDVLGIADALLAGRRRSRGGDSALDPGGRSAGSHLPVDADLLSRGIELFGELLDAGDT
jgi:hypothetical protein